MQTYTRTIAAAGTTGNHTHALDKAITARSVAAQLDISASGAGGTIDWILEGSVDGTNWFAAAFITDADDTPAFDATTETAVGSYVKYFWQGSDAATAARFFKYFRVRTLNNTNVTYKITISWVEADQLDIAGLRVLPAPGGDDEVLAALDGDWHSQALTLARVLAGGNDADALKIVNAADPDDDQDLGTKKYIDDAIAAAVAAIPNGGSQTVKLIAKTFTAAEIADRWYGDQSIAAMELSEVGDGYLLGYWEQDWTNTLDQSVANTSNGLAAYTSEASSADVYGNGDSYTGVWPQANNSASIGTYAAQQVTGAGKVLTLLQPLPGSSLYVLYGGDAAPTEGESTVLLLIATPEAA